MVKLLISLLLIVSSTLLGISASMKLKGRVQSLCSFHEGIHRMKSLISFSGYDMVRVVGECFEKVRGFESFSSADCTYPLYTRWTNSVKTFSSESKLTEKETEILLRFGENLGVTDTEGQLKNCDLYIELVSELISAAKDEEEKKSRLYRVMGFSFGMLTALLIM